MGLVAMALAGLVLAGCDDTKQAFGLDRTVPDEFAVVPRAPLSMPPDYSLPPPRPGVRRPQEQPTRGQAEGLVFGQAVAAGAVDAASADPGGTGQTALLSRAGADQIEPGIRRTVDEESTALVRADESFVDDLIFWHDEVEPGTILDPQAESQRLAEAAAQGEPLNEGEVPIVQRRRQAILEGIF